MKYKQLILTTIMLMEPNLGFVSNTKNKHNTVLGRKRGNIKLGYNFFISTWSCNMYFLK